MKTRSTVSVREGQGVVLLCGPPPHYGGTMNNSTLYAARTSTAIARQKEPARFPAWLAPELICAGSEWVWQIGIKFLQKTLRFTLPRGPFFVILRSLERLERVVTVWVTQAEEAWKSNKLSPGISGCPSSFTHWQFFLHQTHFRSVWNDYFTFQCLTLQCCSLNPSFYIRFVTKICLLLLNTWFLPSW